MSEALVNDELKKEHLALVGNFDAKEWARVFMKTWGHKLQDIDEELMFVWFANSIMAGYDKGRVDEVKSRDEE